MAETKQEKDEKKITVWIQEDLHERFRIKVIQSKGRSMQTVLEELILKFSDGVEVSPREVAESEHDAYIGFVNWLREQPELDIWEPLVAKWKTRGQKIRARS